jgi:serine/threonine protein kinase
MSGDRTVVVDEAGGGLAGGVLLAKRYRVVRQLGQGGMGSVWLVEDLQLDNRPFAVKMLPSILAADKRAYAQLKEEALLSLRLVHPNIVTLRAFEEEGGNPFLVMDYIDGQTLDAFLAEKGRLSEEETAQLLAPIAAALDYAHAKGVIHRDVKPGNIMVARDGTPYILDFGIAREMRETLTRVTGQQSQTSGTLRYMSPEQLTGSLPNAAQDVYSFAAMVYECLTGDPPFCRGNIAYQILKSAPVPLPARFVFSKTAMAGRSKEPGRRPANCSAVLSPAAPAPLEGKSGRWLTGVVIAAALVLGGGIFCKLYRPVSGDGRQPVSAGVRAELPSAAPEPAPAAEVPAPAAEKPKSAPPAAAEDDRRAVEEALRREREAEQKRRAAEQEAERKRQAEELAVAERRRLEQAENLKQYYKILASAERAQTTVATAGLDEEGRATAKELEKTIADAKAWALKDDYKKAWQVLIDGEVAARYSELARQAAERERARKEAELAQQAAERERVRKEAELALARRAAELERAKQEAARRQEQALPPTLTIVARFNGRDVSGAEMKTMNGSVRLPCTWTANDGLTEGRTYQYNVTYTENRMTYYGVFKTTVDWKGHRTQTVELSSSPPSGFRHDPKGINDWAF